MDPLMHAEDEEAPALDEKSQLLAELMEYARGGMAEDMAGRYGKLPPKAPPPAEGDGVEPIPGVDDKPQEGDGAAGGGLDVEALKAILAKMGG